MPRLMPAGSAMPNNTQLPIAAKAASDPTAAPPSDSKKKRSFCPRVRINPSHDRLKKKMLKKSDM